MVIDFGFRVLSLPNAETVMSAGDVLVAVEPIDARAAGAVANRLLEARHRFRFAFRGDFDTSVRQVAHPPLDAFAHRRVFGEKPKADALNASADQVPPCDSHGDRAIIPTFARRGWGAGRAAPDVHPSGFRAAPSGRIQRVSVPQPKTAARRKADPVAS